MLVLAQNAGRNEPLGRVHFPVSCAADVLPDFDRAVALLHHMTYPQARQAFERIAARDTSCAMAHWGVAMTLFQPLWPTRPSPADLRRGFERTARAAALAKTERERAYIAAVAAFYLRPDSGEYWQRIRRWEHGMARVHDAYPTDDEATAFYALAHLAAAPADSTALSYSRRAADLLLGVYRRNPEHPGAMHYLVHANDARTREHQSLDVTRKYESVAPRNPHALHMPTHIYTRLGDWEAVVRGNLAAADAALAHPAGDRGQYVWDEFPHAIEYAIYAYLQQGEDDSAATLLARLRGTRDLEPTFKTAFHLASTSARMALERRAWREAAALVPREPEWLPWDRFPWPEAIVWFARGLGASRTGSADRAREAYSRLDSLERRATGSGEVLFARNIRVLRLGVEAWISQANGDTASATAAMREAANLEAETPKHAVTPAPTLPASELLGDLLMEQRRPKEALAAYRRGLALDPRRLNGVLGAARAAKATGDTAAAREYYQRLIEIAEGGTRQAPIRESREYLEARR